MNLILRWLLKQMGNMLAGCFALSANISIMGFNNSTIKALFSLFKTLGISIFGISLVIMLIKAMIDVADNKDVDFGNIMKRTILGVLIFTYAIDLMQNFYLLLLKYSQKIIGAISGTTEIKLSLWDFDITGISTILVVVLLIIAAFYMIKTILNLLERFWMLVITLLMLYLYLPGYVAGNDEGIIMWFKSCVGIGLTQLFQSVIIVIGMNIFAAGGDVASFGLALGAIIGASKVDTLMDKYGQSAGGKVGNLGRNAMSSVFYAKQLTARR